MDSSAHHYYWAFAKNAQACSRRLGLKRRAIFDNVRIQRLWGALAGLYFSFFSGRRQIAVEYGFGAIGNSRVTILG
jgi:hypothetical protein